MRRNGAGLSGGRRAGHNPVGGVRGPCAGAVPTAGRGGRGSGRLRASCAGERRGGHRQDHVGRRGRGAERSAGRLGSCAEAGRTPAFWPWTVALRGLLAALAASDVAELTRSDAAELARLVPELAAEPTVLDPTVLDPGAGGHGGDADAARLRVGGENPVMSHVTCTYSCRRPPGRSHRRGRAVAPERGGCGSEELPPGRTGPQRGGIDAGALQDLQTVEATTRWPRPTSSP